MVTSQTLFPFTGYLFISIQLEASVPSRGFSSMSTSRAACKLGLEGVVSKRKDSAYRSGRSPDWLKMKNSDAPAVKRAPGTGFFAAETEVQNRPPAPSRNRRLKGRIGKARR
jgi:hypothetical protein